MAIFRVHKTKDYTVMSNRHFREKDMSLKAKGLLSLMLSLPDDWDYSVKGLAAICRENETSIKTALRELQKYGYLRVTKHFPSKETGGLIAYTYDVFERPMFGTQDIDDQGVEDQGVENQGVENLPLENHPLEVNTNILNTNILNTKYNNNTSSNKPSDDILRELADLYFEIKPEEAQELYQLRDERGEAMVLGAATVATFRHKRTFAGLKEVLEEWERDGVSSPADGCNRELNGILRGNEK